MFLTFSSVTYLLTKLHEPDEGTISIDGHDLKLVDTDSLTEHIGILTQETFLLNDTIKNNLLFAKPHATEEELQNACAVAHLTELIESLPLKMETTVGERGYSLSGGERQRLSLARIILKNPSILVLDEFNAHLVSIKLETFRLIQ